MWVVIAMFCAALSAWSASPVGRGLDRLRGPTATPFPFPSAQRMAGSPVARGVLCSGALALLGWVFAGPAGGIVGVPAGIALATWVGRLESPEAARTRAEIDRDLALALDLLAACTAAGRPPQDSLAVVGRAVGGALARSFEELNAGLVLGGDPAGEWGRFLAHPQLGGLARTMQRSAESGAPLVDGLARQADDHRRERRTRCQVRARSVGVRVAGPLAACFLPAFMLVGVVPTVAGSFQHLFP